MKVYHNTLQTTVGAESFDQYNARIMLYNANGGETYVINELIHTHVINAQSLRYCFLSYAAAT